MTERSVLRPSDAMRVSLVGLKTRTTRAILSALGITIGIASMVAVLATPWPEVDPSFGTTREIGRILYTDYLLLVEHPPTYTIGRNGDGSNLRVDEAALPDPPSNTLPALPALR